MAATLRFAARKVSSLTLQQATAFVSSLSAIKEEQRCLLPRLIPGAGGRMPLLRPFSSSGAPNDNKHDHQPHTKPIADVDLSRVPESIRPQVESWNGSHYAHTKFVNVESSHISCKEPASLRAQVEEKKDELLHMLFELKFGRKSITGGEKPNL